MANEQVNTKETVKRIELMRIFRENTIEVIVMLDIEVRHGNKLAAAIKKQIEANKENKEKTGDLSRMFHKVNAELSEKELELGNKRMAVAILEEMIAEEEKNPSDVMAIAYPPEVKIQQNRQLGTPENPEKVEKVTPKK